MSRKAAERRAAPDSFVEANLWVVTRGRPYKPRFRAERSVVVVSGGGAVTADAEVAPPRSVHGARRPEPSVLSAPTRPMAAVLDAAACAEALFARTACEALYVLDYSPLARDMPSELASPYPGRVAKPASRLLRKLNPADAILAADGADAALALKVLPTLGDDDVRRSSATPAHPRPPSALSARARGRRVRPGGAPSRSRPAHTLAVFREDADADADADAESALGASREIVLARRAGGGRRLRPRILDATDDAPAFSRSPSAAVQEAKQIVQRVENVTGVVEAAMSANAATAAATRADDRQRGKVGGRRTPAPRARRTRSRLRARRRRRDGALASRRSTDAKPSAGSTDYAKSPDSTGASPSSVAVDPAPPRPRRAPRATFRAELVRWRWETPRGRSPKITSDVAAAVGGGGGAAATRGDGAEGAR